MLKRYDIGLSSLSPKLRNDMEVIVEAVKQNGDNYCFAGRKIKNNKELVLDIIKNYNIENISIFIHSLPFNLKNDKDIALEIVKKDGICLKLFDDEIKNDKKIVYEACKNDPYAFVYAGYGITCKYPTMWDFLNSQKDIAKDNEKKTNVWVDKVNSDKPSDLER